MIGRPRGITLSSQANGQSVAVSCGEETLYIDAGQLKRVKYNAATQGLRKQLLEEQDRLRKLKMLNKARSEHADLDDKISKWREAVVMVIDELRQRLGNEIDFRRIFQGLGINGEEFLEAASTSEGDSELDADALHDDETSC
jgi:DNA-directed RNA polymerase specialized sigma subunit